MPFSNTINRGHTSDMIGLKKYLCFGSEAGCVQVGEKESFSLEHVPSIISLLEANRGKEVVDEIRRYSQVEGTSSTKVTVIFALAVCARIAKDADTKQAVQRIFNDVCRTSIEFFQFIDFMEKIGKTTGWGRAQRKTVSSWYNSRDPMALAVEVSRYRARRGWSHEDVLRLGHVKAQDDAHRLVLKYVINGIKGSNNEQVDEALAPLVAYLEAVETVKHASDCQKVARLVEEHKLYCQQIPTWMNKSKEVWGALVQHIDVLDFLANIERIATLGLLDALSSESMAGFIIDKLKNVELITESKIQPFTFLLAMKCYEKGKSQRGKKPEWNVNGAVLDALQQAFHASFKNVETTGKRYLLAVDVSASMQYGGVNGSEYITPAIAMSAMALLTAKTETQYDMVGFSDCMTKVKLNNGMNLEEIQHAISEVKMGGTDCAKPITWAAKSKKEVDVFIVYTDCETWIGSSQNPSNELRNYRASMNMPNTKLIVCALTSNGFTLADPADPGMLDIAGFDDTTPAVMRRFVTDDL